jgi:5'-deoxynucleotidase YfbR-like HD superfamily hydrolase
MIDDQLEFIMNGGWTKRFHGVPILNQQTDAEHMFMVAQLVAIMALDANPLDGAGLTVPLLMAALCSDLPEWVTGDLPAPSKRSFPRVIVNGEESSFREAWNKRDAELLSQHGMDWEEQLIPQQIRWLKLADAMEGCLFCIKERKQGNRYIGKRCYIHFRQYIYDVLDGDKPSPKEYELIYYIDKAWNDAESK